jgi:hypothetical protein
MHYANVLVNFKVDYEAFKELKKQDAPPTLQATIGLIRSDVNNMRNDFEKAAAALIEVDPYSKARRPHTNKSSAQISAIDFASGRGGSGVDLRCNTPLDF